MKSHEEEAHHYGNPPNRRNIRNLTTIPCESQKSDLVNYQFFLEAHILNDYGYDFFFVL